MSEPLVFRIVFSALFLLLFGVVTTYRVKAQARRTIDYSKEGGAVFLALRLGGLSIWLYCLLYGVYPPAVSWSFIELPSVLRWAGVGLVVAVDPVHRVGAAGTWAQRLADRDDPRGPRTGDRRAIPLDSEPALHRRGLAVHWAGVDLCERLSAGRGPGCPGARNDPAPERGGRAGEAVRRRLPRLRSTHRSVPAAASPRVARRT